jgi:hypothetical protein
MNKDGAAQEQGATASVFENAGFVRIKDITLSYNFATGALRNLGIDKLQIYLTGRNLFTITKWGGLDPELDSQRAIPLQKEYVAGLNLGF